MPIHLDSLALKHLTVNRIKVLTATEPVTPEVLAALAADARAGVRAIGRSLEHARARVSVKAAHDAELRAREERLRDEGYRVIAGVDEAGRGPLAGPVVAAAVVLPEGCEIAGLDDSKKLTAHRREELYERITTEAVWGIGIAEHDEIDADGILVAALGCMRTAVEAMGIEPDVALVDGDRSPGLKWVERLEVDGDARFRSIAAASIVAKVTRDRIMVAMDRVFPGYGFAGHKGYGAATHVDALRHLGPCPIHRLTFRLVPEVAPPGMVAAVLNRRIAEAPTREHLERAAAAINRIRDFLNDADLDRLRAVYRDRLHALDGKSSS